MNTTRDPFAAIPSALSVLHLEDEPGDAELVSLLLNREWPGCQILRVETREGFVAALRDRKFDLILSDFSMPNFDGLSALEIAQPLAIPFIFLSGTIGEDNAAHALQRGATDYILKDRPGRLIPAIRRALGEAREHRRRRNAEARVHEQAEFLNKARDAIIVSDLKRRIIYWNQGAEEMLGWTSAEALARTEEELFGASAFSEIDRVRRTITGEAWRGEVSLVNKAGTPLILESRVTLIHGPAGEPKSHLIISSDITEQRKLEKQFLRAQRMESIGILAGGIAHDINNVLAPVLMAVGLVGHMTKDPEILRLMKILEMSALRGASLVRQILAFAKGVDGERAEIQPEILIRETTSLLTETLPKSVMLETDLPPDLSPVSADATQLSQVIMNLCVNARDAMPAGGRLRVQAANVAVGPAQAQAHPGAKPGPHVLVSVEDTGVGIPPGMIDRIFDPFFTTKGPGKGTGLGLASVLGIVKGHGGFLEVQSEVRRGTKFSLFFPAISAAAAAPVSDPPAAAAPRGSGETILVIDDEKAIGEMLRLVLLDAGYRALIAHDGASGLALYREHHAEVKAVLLDLMMPEMQGLEVIARLRAIDPAVRIVTMSGVLNAPGSFPSKPGALDSLQKPMTAETVLSALAQVLR
ncbi:MAG: hybrid sensor histidine kinase/response regulator [Verrucomicrobia bacterium]|nr:hybrid sensor histidine kinase/response regulator [Verrucomicrobiota bacterium]